MRAWSGWLGLALATVAVASAQAYYLDEGRNFDFRLRAYTQVGILTESSEREGCPDPLVCPPEYSAGDLAQHRTFYNPEFDARLTPYGRWMSDVPGLSLVAPDDLKFRFAWWGFYDGLYDYLDGPWNEHRQRLRGRFSQSDHPRESFTFDDQRKEPRAVYGHRNRINELYLDWTSGRVNVRVGRQAISWGESDTIALLDVQNPFDLTMGVPGLFQDIDEARIPLWTLRSTVKLVDSWRFLSSLFADVYLVPGVIDTTVPIDPILGGVSPFSPDNPDPQVQVAGQVIPGAAGQTVPTRIHTVTVQRLPERTWGNSRWGARLAAVLFGDYTVQGWFFRTFNQAPVPVLASPGGPELLLANRLRRTQIDDRGNRVPVCRNFDLDPASPTFGFGRTPSGRLCSLATPVVTLLERRLESVIGLAATWYSEPLAGIIRTELEYFIDELAFIPERNLNARSQIPRQVLPQGVRPVRSSIPTADYLRFLLGYDKFFFVRWINPANSILLSTAFTGSINIDEGGDTDYRAPNQKPGKPAAVLGRPAGIDVCQGDVRALPPSLQQLCLVTPAKNFENVYKFEGFLQTAIQSEYMHGKISPRIVMITDISGIFAFAPTVTYRISDSFLLSGTYLAIASHRKSGLATFRAHDMAQLRLTYQLN
jgi:hypothetical protein